MFTRALVGALFLISLSANAEDWFPKPQEASWDIAKYRIYWKTVGSTQLQHKRGLMMVAGVSRQPVIDTPDDMDGSKAADLAQRKRVGNGLWLDSALMANRDCPGGNCVAWEYSEAGTNVASLYPIAQLSLGLPSERSSPENEKLDVEGDEYSRRIPDIKRLDLKPTLRRPTTEREIAGDASLGFEPSPVAGNQSVFGDIRGFQGSLGRVCSGIDGNFHVASLSEGEDKQAESKQNEGNGGVSQPLSVFGKLRREIDKSSVEVRFALGFLPLLLGGCLSFWGWNDLYDDRRWRACLRLTAAAMVASALTQTDGSMRVWSQSPWRLRSRRMV